MTQKKKNSFFTFLFSFVPGIAEMYMGFMKNGISLFAVFAVGVMSGFTVFEYASIVLWFYGFFHARNLAAMTDEEFQQRTDIFIWEELFDGKETGTFTHRNQLIFAAILIFFGVSVLWNYFINYLSVMIIPDSMWESFYEWVSELPNCVLAVGMIVIGILLIRGKKKELAVDETEEDGE